MRIFITGANGFIGGAVASVLIAGGHHVRGLVRDRAKAEAVRVHGIEPVIGSLDDSSLLQAEARGADGVVNLVNWRVLDIGDHPGSWKAQARTMATELGLPRCNARAE